MAGMSNTLIDALVNATTPTGTSGVPGTYTALSSSAMKLMLTTTASTASTSGTELTGTGYTAGGQAFTEAATASSGGTGVTIPETTALSWTNGSGGDWDIVGWELRDNAGVRTWFGTFTGQPITIGDGSTFSIDAGGIGIGLA